VGGLLDVSVTVPTGTTASVLLPGSAEPVELGPGTHVVHGGCRRAEDDPPQPVLWRPHDNQNERVA
jgi:hypothetical protein